MTLFLALSTLWHALWFSPQMFPFPGNPPVSGGGFTILHSLTVQSLSGTTLACVAATCTLTVPAMGSGNSAILMIAEVSGNNLTVSSVTGGGTWTSPANVRVFDAGEGMTTGLYNLSTTAGTTSLIINWTGGNPTSTFFTVAMYWEISGPIALDIAGSVFNSSLSTTQHGPALILSGSNDAIGQICGLSTGTVNSGASPYAANFSNRDNGSQGGAFQFIGGSVALNIASGASPVFSTSNAKGVCSGMALK